MYLLQSTFAKNVALLIQFILGHGYYVSLGEAFRTPQQALWNEQHGLGIKNSLHCNRMAIDLNIHDSKGQYLKEGDIYTMAGRYWESLDNRNRYGGFFTTGTLAHADYYHFEMHEQPIHDPMRKLK